jgi:hypothetical protein
LAKSLLARRHKHRIREDLLLRKQQLHHTPLNLHRCLAPEVSKQLLFISAKSAPKGLFFDDEVTINVQATRGIRELTAASAVLLDKIIERTDALPRTAKETTVTANMLVVG